VSRLVLASTSRARISMLENAGLAFDSEAPGVDEAPAKACLLEEGASPQKIAEMLAAMKAMAVSERRPGLVIGADQTLDLEGELIDKAGTPEEVRQHLYQLRGRKHRLHSAVVVAKDGAPLWRTTDSASLSMRVFGEAFLDGYLARNGDRVLSSVGGYQLEGEGVQLFDEIHGDYFTILGLPLLRLLEFLRERGAAPA
jgi:nucleoside triphosphate pyrophosphatase